MPNVHITLENKSLLLKCHTDWIFWAEPNMNEVPYIGHTERERHLIEY